jgi:hypothetical protein
MAMKWIIPGAAINKMSATNNAWCETVWTETRRLILSRVLANEAQIGCS